MPGGYPAAGGVIRDRPFDKFFLLFETGRVTVALLEEPDTVRDALVPLRRRLLARLRTPASASELAREFEVSRQKLNYHLHKLEGAGLVELVGQRQRRGFVERVLKARADAYVVDPACMSGPSPASAPARATGTPPTTSWRRPPPPSAR